MSANPPTLEGHHLACQTLVMFGYIRGLRHGLILTASCGDLRDEPQTYQRNLHCLIILVGVQCLGFSCQTANPSKIIMNRNLWVDIQTFFLWNPSNKIQSQVVWKQGHDHLHTPDTMPLVDDSGAYDSHRLGPPRDQLPTELDGVHHRPSLPSERTSHSPKCPAGSNWAVALWYFFSRVLGTQYLILMIC